MRMAVVTPDLWNILESLEQTAITFALRSLGGRNINRESKLDLLVDLGLVDWKTTDDGTHELYTINARGREALKRYRRQIQS
jgi:hypothetical protein